MPSSPLEFPTKFVSQFMHVDTNVTHSCATIALVPLFTHFRFSLRNENFWVIFKHCAILGATKWKKIFCTKKRMESVYRRKQDGLELGKALLGLLLLLSAIKGSDGEKEMD